MNIPELWQKFKDQEEYEMYLYAAILVCVAIIAFVLGRLSVSEMSVDTREYGVVKSSLVPNITQQAAEVQRVTEPIPASVEDAEAMQGYVASKNGTKYHLPWCSGAKRIKEENKVFFKTKEEAEKAGYTPAANCKGI